jgi:hypothetical protein
MATWGAKDLTQNKWQIMKLENNSLWMSCLGDSKLFKLES